MSTPVTVSDLREIVEPRGDGSVEIGKLHCTGKGFCTGGRHPSPPLHGHGLLCWTHLKHPKFGFGVYLEDQSASVEQVALELAVTPELGAIAAKFGTSATHVAQAIDYAIKANLIA
jgi:hypothetical protein